MKLKVLLILSVAANILLVVYVFRPTPEDSGSGPEERVAPSAEAVSATVKPVASKPTQESRSVPQAGRTFNWKLVESPDYREYIANLRAIGCPEETIRDIIVADVNKLYAAKKREARGEPKEFEYWKSGNPWIAQMDPEYLARTRALEEEKLAVLRQLGIEPDLKMQVSSLADPMGALDTMFGFLPEDKQMSVMKVMQDMQSELAESAGEGGFDPEAMQETQRRMEAAIKEILTPEEFRDYELRMSMTANTLRSQLAGWDPDEQEFLKVYELRKAFDDEYSMFTVGNETEAERRQRQEAQTQMNDAIKEALGETRYAEYQRAQDWDFRQIHQAARRADLGTTEAVKVYEMRQAAQAEALSVRQDQDLTSGQRTAALQGIQAETERSIKTVLGEKGWEQYDRGYNTAWLKNLVPSTPPAEAPQ